MADKTLQEFFNRIEDRYIIDYDDDEPRLTGKDLDNILDILVHRTNLDFDSVSNSNEFLELLYTKLNYYYFSYDKKSKEIIIDDRIVKHAGQFIYPIYIEDFYKTKGFIHKEVFEYIGFMLFHIHLKDNVNAILETHFDYFVESSEGQVLKIYDFIDEFRTYYPSEFDFKDKEKYSENELSLIKSINKIYETNLDVTAFVDLDDYDSEIDYSYIGYINDHMIYFDFSEEKQIVSDFYLESINSLSNEFYFSLSNTISISKEKIVIHNRYDRLNLLKIQKYITDFNDTVSLILKKNLLC